MDDWGLNPSTFQAIGGIATAAALLAVVANTAVTYRVAKLATREASLRTRPWVGLTNIVHHAGAGPDELDKLWLEYRNVGLLPAVDLNIQLLAEVVAGDEDTLAPRSHDLGNVAAGSIFPNQNSNWMYTFEGGDAFKYWRAQRHNVHLAGTFRYRYGDDTYSTSVICELDFAHEDVVRHWSNRKVL